MSAEEALPTPELIAKYVKQNVARFKKSAMATMMDHEGAQEIVRQDDYKGHHIVVRTIYQITIDGKAVSGHLMLTNDGQVQYHGLPNRSFDSTIQLARTLIDKFPEDFEKSGKGSALRGMETMKTRGKEKASGMPSMDMGRKSKSHAESSGKNRKTVPAKTRRAKSTRPKTVHRPR